MQRTGCRRGRTLCPWAASVSRKTSAPPLSFWLRRRPSMSPATPLPSMVAGLPCDDISNNDQRKALIMEARRVVTGFDTDGKPAILADSAAPVVFGSETVPEYQIAEICVIDHVPTALDAVDVSG